MSDEALIVFDTAALTVPPTLTETIAKWQDYCVALKADRIPYNEMGMQIAADIAEGKAKAAQFLRNFEREAKAWREIETERHLAKKTATDSAVMGLSAAIAELQDELLEFEAEKKRVERAINDQREREAAEAARIEREKQAKAEDDRRAAERAERDRLAEINRKAMEATNARAKAECEEARLTEEKRQAEAAAAREQDRIAEAARLKEAQTVIQFEAVATEGVAAKVAYDYEITSKRELAEYCWRTNRLWVNEISFFKRDITEHINREGADRNIPGLRVFQVLGVTTKRPAKEPKPINVSSRRIEL